MPTYKNLALEREIEKAEAVYGDTVRLRISDLVARGVATPAQISRWAIVHDKCAWLEGASHSVVRNVYRGQMRLLVKRRVRGGLYRYFTYLFVGRSLLEK